MLGCLRRQAEIEGVAETREPGQQPERHRLGPDPSEKKPSNPSLGKSDGPGLAIQEVVDQGLVLQPPRNSAFLG